MIRQELPHALFYLAHAAAEPEANYKRILPAISTSFLERRTLAKPITLTAAPPNSLGLGAKIKALPDKLPNWPAILNCGNERLLRQRPGYGRAQELVRG